GVQPPAPEWSAMLAAGKDYIRNYPHLTLFPGITIVIINLALNMVGDGLRDALDPKLKD
ncbi:UNVERIFIED_CONTAM: ABC transporter permease, partial [Bacteroidetes bacterium 56_B9]